jgi:hypothetical protein
MNDEGIFQEIAYLDSGLDKQSAGIFSPAEMIALVRDALQIEMAKQGHLRKAEDVSERLASLETRVELMRREFIRQRGIPSVIYVRRGELITPAAVLQHLHLNAERMGETHQSPAVESKPPTAMVVFYGLGLACSLIFATLLALSTMKVDTIHPFLSLLGLVGGLGWLTTAWTDLLLWKRENPSAATNATTSKAGAIPSSSAR